MSGSRLKSEEHSPTTPAAGKTIGGQGSIRTHEPTLSGRCVHLGVRICSPLNQWRNAVNHFWGRGAQGGRCVSRPRVVPTAVHRAKGGRENVYLAPILLGETKRCSTVGEGLRTESQRLL
jgi:hypothetical protein